MKMIRKRRMFAKMFGLLLSLLLLSVFTAQVHFAADAFISDKHIKTGLNCDNCHGAAKVAAGAEVGMAKLTPLRLNLLKEGASSFSLTIIF